LKHDHVVATQGDFDPHIEQFQLRRSGMPKTSLNFNALWQPLKSIKTPTSEFGFIEFSPPNIFSPPCVVVWPWHLEGPGFGAAAEALLFRQKDPKPFPPKSAH